MRALLYLPIAALAVAAAGCGNASHSSAPPTAPATTSTAATASTRPAAPKPVPTTTAATGPGALQAEANATAAGDIPDNQIFLTFRDPAAAFTMKVPEGWAQRGSGTKVTFRDKNNIVRVVIGHGSGATAMRAATHDLGNATVTAAPHRITLPAGPAYKVTYTTESAPNAVTGKRVKLVVDRYYVSKGKRLAVVDLGTPVGVDNVDAYRLMIESFRWK